ncbi:putative ATP-dependent helicase-like protein [Hapsidospora chrysogenum ATCC 11550]|uniref:Putative ATP-dependent helicase-like protein n=1 Tax=Hapsidospora chrysogenum (strain ATCC 11550 / CBS 779.69 / DSM 880 / IAM 14645 / JCM 23072 / IMI 49137) TaxID=857340 RepID=A0A086T8F2_HAPC1|nr:putative ATP-dependent helicase-like protein [Hapsidospora chrysogenum ATCC 11550]
MPDIKANTHAEQLAQIKAYMAEGGDTRRTSTQKKDLARAMKSFGYKRVKAVNGRWVLKKTMKSSLLNYQLTVASWMCMREVCGEPPGGLIADEMGMGKTVVSLACVSEHMAEKEDIKDYSRATLVVVPSHEMALQWQEEIQRHCASRLANSVVVYAKRNGAVKPQAFRCKFIVITTYRELLNSYPRQSEVNELKEKHSNDVTSVDRAISRVAGVLFKVNWYRVILDEAHHIKNANSRTTFACCALSAKHRWCLSGTPLSNTPRELYPYLKFLRCCLTGTRKTFEDMTKKDAFLGHKIIDLPASEAQDLWISPSKEEDIILQAVMAKSYDTAIEDGENPETESAVSDDAEVDMDADEVSSQAQDQDEKLRRRIVLRTAQAISHPLNLESLFRTRFAPQDIRSLTKELSEQGGKLTLSDQLRNDVKDPSGLPNFQRGLRSLAKFQKPAFGGQFDMRRLLEVAENDAKVRDAPCATCGKAPPKSAMGTATAITDLNELTTLSSIVVEAASDKDYQEPASDSNNARIVTNASRNGFFTASCRDGNMGGPPPSGKLTMAMAVILEWQEDHPEDKIIGKCPFLASALYAESATMLSPQSSRNTS